ncbi:MAG: hypothetical protein N3G20_08150, partial [Verrucomicrobiae bacterium]|nr:hypothetical protein [Verrucomicrobiae bacterium]
MAMRADEVGDAVRKITGSRILSQGDSSVATLRWQADPFWHSARASFINTVGINGLVTRRMSLLVCGLMVVFPFADLLAGDAEHGTSALREPVAVYNNWSAYDELSDNVELTEDLAMRQLREILRLRKHGVRIDYYLMDAFWFDPRGGYRAFRKPHWPNGPDRWLEGCKQAGIKPGLWFASNSLRKLEPIPEWWSSLAADGKALSMFEGGYLSHLMETLQIWYDRGVRLYKFDFAELAAATPAAAARMKKDEVVEANSQALRRALAEFKRKNPDALFTAFNGFGGRYSGTFHPIEQTVDTRWLEVFDALYCGDPRPADVPMFNFWRAQDVYSDHMVRYYQANGVPLTRIDNTGFMVGTTGTCYRRGTSAWESMLVLQHARGGWLNQYYGNLELIDDRRSVLFAKVQRMFFQLLSTGRTETFGGLPGRGEPYGFVTANRSGAVCTTLNPSQSVVHVQLPVSRLSQELTRRQRILFADPGFKPTLSHGQVSLGPEQMVVIGFGSYAEKEWDLGTGSDIRIPSVIKPLQVTVSSTGHNTIEVRTHIPRGSSLRILMRQTLNGQPRRVSGGAPP